MYRARPQHLQWRLSLNGAADEFITLEKRNDVYKDKARANEWNARSLLSCTVAVDSLCRTCGLWLSRGSNGACSLEA